MPTSLSGYEETEDFPADPSASGPAPHEDLTIGELLDSMRAVGEQRPGEQCFINENHEKCWFPDDRVDHFMAAYGSEHPSTYRRLLGADWKEHFFHPLPK